MNANDHGEPDHPSGAEPKAESSHDPAGGDFDPSHAPSRSIEWLKGEGDSSEVVLSSRVRLARNLAGFPFPPYASPSDRAQILEICRRSIDAAGSIEDDATMRWIDLREAPPIERRLLVERQIMSRQHDRGRYANGEGGTDSPRGVVVYEPDERVSVLVNEEDHLRLQVIHAGLSLGQCMSEANALDDKIESIVDYAFHPRFGYLTACPTNVGTGLRLSVMVHLPALKITGELEKVRNAANDMGLAVRGIYGEGSQAAGEFYQISNQVTLGKSDEMLLHEIEGQVIPTIVRYEKHARLQLLNDQHVLLENRVFRSLGILRNARMMQAEESLEHLGLVRLGILMGLVEDIDITRVHALLLQVQPGHLQATLGQRLSQAQRRVARASLIRERLTTT